jgi:MOSC domain-containing protein YiiM
MDGITPETCAECGFDARRWRRRDVVTYLGALGFWWRHALDDIDADRLNQRPAAGVWSALEYAGHTAVVTAMIRYGIERILERDGVELPALLDDADDESAAPSTLDRDAVLADIEREAAVLVDVVEQAGPDGWTHTGRAGDATIQAEAALLHAAHDASHHGYDVARNLADLGLPPAIGDGRLDQINTSGGGVPKQPVPEGRIDLDGLAGDHQADGKHHGRPFQALCLWSSEVIAGLAADGHPITAGAAGENLTLAGLDWDSVRPGQLLRVGEVLAEVSFPATPCAKQTRWFTDGDFGRLDHGRNPGLTRWYAWVREPGTVRPGDPVVMSPMPRK